MAGDFESLEAKVERLARQLDELSCRVDFLQSYLRVPGPESLEAARRAHQAGPADEEIINWAGRASLLPRVATLCFLLAVALVLRTLTDNKILDTPVGPTMGMGYAGGLMLVGFYKYRKASRLAGVFAVCGALLLCSIVVESHQRFHFLPSAAAYAILLATGLGMAAASHRFKTSLPALAGLLGMCLGSTAIDYPSPFFPFLAVVLLIANLLGYSLARRGRVSAPQWVILLFTMFILTLWSSKLAIALGKKDQEIPDFLALYWFLPLLGSFAISYPAISLMGIINEKTQRTPRFNLVLPGLAGLWAFALAYQVVEAWGESPKMLGLAGVFWGVAHMGVAHWLARRPSGEARGTNSFAVAACLLLGLGLPVLTGEQFWALPLLSATALGLAMLEGVWKSGGVRLTSYLLQFYAGVAVALLFLERGRTGQLPAQALSGGLIGFMGMLHYRLCRARKPLPGSSVFFSRYDKGDKSVILLLVGSLLSGFFLLRALIQEGLYLAPGDFENSFRCAQSILVNLTAAALMVYAYVWGDEDARNLAVLATLVGGTKVFLFDLLQARGVPLVLSVLSFGMAALLESAVLGRWQRRAKEGLQASAQLKPPPREA